MIAVIAILSQIISFCIRGLAAISLSFVQQALSAECVLVAYAFTRLSQSLLTPHVGRQKWTHAVFSEDFSSKSTSTMLSIDNVVVDRRRASIVAGHIAARLTGRAASKLVSLLSSPPDYVCMTYDTRIALHSPKFSITAWIDQCLFRTRFWSFWSFWSYHRDFLLGV